MNTGAYDDYHPYDDLIVKLYGDAKLAQGRKGGHYNLASTTVNGKKYWIHDQGSNAIWYYKEQKCWHIGPKKILGTAKCCLYTTNDTTGPEEATTWIYWNRNENEWMPTSNIFESPSMYLLFQNIFASYFLLI